MGLKGTFVPSLFLLAALGVAQASQYALSSVAPPRVAREFRGVWIATVANLDWPSKPGLSTAQQKAELLAILDRAVQLKLNAVIFQVRPACDAFYASKIEPWSEYLTGTMGRAPDPYYDPLSSAIEEAHRRGLELHAWFNPYRALHTLHTGPIAANHISRMRPDLVRTIISGGKKLLWLDPGERDVQDYSIKVILDVVKRYDIDGVQIDDYFYPDQDGASSFPDEASWKRFGAGGKLSRDDWRRQNVNTFVERLYRAIKTEKPWVQFGISPRGIWRPGNPPQITGTDDYAQHYADSRKWLVNGWLDCFSPQLYWPIGKKEQSFPVLLKWWTEQNAKGRHIWPSLAAWQAPQWSRSEIPDQIRAVRKQSGATGFILFRAKSIMRGTALGAALESGINDEPALVPASPWLGRAVNAGGPLP